MEIRDKAREAGILTHCVVDAGIDSEQVTLTFQVERKSQQDRELFSR